jgi:hypothetical protein
LLPSEAEKEIDQAALVGQMVGADTPADPPPPMGREMRDSPPPHRGREKSGQSETTQSHLSLAAGYLGKGDEASAGLELAQYLAEHSEHFEVRLHFAEMLLRQGKLDGARVEFTRVIAQAQELGDKTVDMRLHCHSVLMEVAMAQDDDYNLHFQRGVGLYLVALRRAKLPDPHGQLPVEGLLCRAAGELGQARALRPEEAQPCWYLHLTWSALGQQGPATRWLQRAMAAAPFTSLTPSEQRGLQWAVRAADIRNLRPFPN